AELGPRAPLALRPPAAPFVPAGVGAEAAGAAGGFRALRREGLAALLARPRVNRRVPARAVLSAEDVLRARSGPAAAPARRPRDAVPARGSDRDAERAQVSERCVGRSDAELALDRARPEALRVELL